MGTWGSGEFEVEAWGSGNFDSETGRDRLTELTFQLITEVAEAMSGEPTDIEAGTYWCVAIPCNLELLHLIAQTGLYGAVLPDPDTITGWKTTFLGAWDETIDALRPVPGFKEQRRAVLVKTFDRLAELAAAVKS